MKVIDASNAVLGRLASYVAKQVLNGEEVAIVNCGEAIVVGREREVLNKFRKKRERHGSSQRGPKYPTMPKNVLKRVIRGMLPKKERGRKALKRVKCYQGIPKKLKDEKMIKSGKGKSGIKLNKVSEMLR